MKSVVSYIDGKHLFYHCIYKILSLHLQSFISDKI